MTANITVDNAYDFAASWLWYEESIKCAERNGERTWLCPACGKMRSLFGQLCLFCRGDEEDYRDERETQSQLRHGG